MPGKNRNWRSCSRMRNFAGGCADALSVAMLCLGSPVAPSRGDTLIDNLCITDNGYYGSAISSHCGGRARWGDSYDYQAADDFKTPSAWFVTLVTWDCLYEYQGTPEAFCWSLYSSADDVIQTAEYAHGAIEASAAHVEVFDDPVFGYSGKRTRPKSSVNERPFSGS